MLEQIIDKKYEGNSITTTMGTRCLCKTVGDDFLHVLFAGLSADEEKHLSKELNKIKKTGPRLDDYLSFLGEADGAILYAGSIILFGYSVKRKDEDEPSSLIVANKQDSVSKVLNQVIYIGNMPCSEGGNINIYFNVNSGLVTGYYKNAIVITWANISDFLDKIICRYDKCYMSDGRNKSYGIKDETVYNNIQKYTLKEK